jgi:hypothetical protein
MMTLSLSFQRIGYIKKKSIIKHHRYTCVVPEHLRIVSVAVVQRFGVLPIAPDPHSYLQIYNNASQPQCYNIMIEIPGNQETEGQEILVQAS